MRKPQPWMRCGNGRLLRRSRGRVPPKSFPRAGFPMGKPTSRGPSGILQSVPSAWFSDPRRPTIPGWPCSDGLFRHFMEQRRKVMKRKILATSFGIAIVFCFAGLASAGSGMDRILKLCKYNKIYLTCSTSYNIRGAWPMKILPLPQTRLAASLRGAESLLCRSTSCPCRSRPLRLLPGLCQPPPASILHDKIDFSEPVAEGKVNRRAVDMATRQKICSWREHRLSAGEIAQLLSEEGIEISVRTVERVLAEEGYPKLPRRSG
jgi:hypothetical protein